MDRAMSSTRCAGMPDARSSTGTISGGSPTIRSRPSTRRVSRASARVLSLVCAFSIARAKRRCVVGLAWARQRSTTAAMSSLAYQTSRSLIAANSAMADR